MKGTQDKTQDRTRIPDGAANAATETQHPAAALPPDFKYREAYLRGRPVHDGDAFAAKHPRMPREKRAKQFAPFDALSGFSDSIEQVNNIYYAD